jgi:G protein-coupled receptor GPR1
MHGQPGDYLLDPRSHPPIQGLGPAEPGSIGTFSRAQNRAILIVGVTTASFSLAIAVVSLRWFLCMKRSFRHHLILMLIVSDSFKALWYFLSPIVIFSRGHIESSSAFSQASGFLLALGVEAADLSILFIVLHATLYIFHPPQRLGNGGLYNYRYWIYGLWILLPLLAASLAFTNRSGPAYVTSGTFSYLPKRPFWYRLALAWIPRYIIFVSIITMYTAIYVYVKVKFKGFSNLGSHDSSFNTSSMQASTLGQKSLAASSASPQGTRVNSVARHERYGSKPSAATPQPHDSSANLANARRQSPPPDDRLEWDRIDFITTSPLVAPQRLSQLSLGIEAADFAHEAGTRPNNSGSGLSLAGGESANTVQKARNDSTAPTCNTNYTSETAVHSSPTSKPNGANDPLAMTRIAIRRQLRFLFIYPIIYLLLWILPFVQHCLNYTNYYVTHPQFGLNICITFILALQAGVDCAIFSWRERPWRRMNGSPFISVWVFRKLKARFSNKEEQRAQGDEDQQQMDLSDVEAGKPKERKRDSNWWEEEGKKRKDSVWLGTDTVDDIIRTQTRQSAKVASRVG